MLSMIEGNVLLWKSSQLFWVVVYCATMVRVVVYCATMVSPSWKLETKCQAARQLFVVRCGSLICMTYCFLSSLRNKENKRRDNKQELTVCCFYSSSEIISRNLQFVVFTVVERKVVEYSHEGVRLSLYPYLDCYQHAIWESVKLRKLLWYMRILGPKIFTTRNYSRSKLVDWSVILP